MSVRVTTRQLQQYLAGTFRGAAKDLAGANRYISKAEQRAGGDTFLSREANKARDASPKGAWLNVNDLVDQAMTDVMNTLAIVSPRGLS